MTFVVTENCRGCRYTDCVAVCPVDCFHGDGEMLYIDPNRCIDCGACIPECPVEAIFEEGTVPNDQAGWLLINADRAARLPVVNTRESPLKTAAARACELGFLRLTGG
ncbi:MAG TPA: ferredoxin family protein [Polyangiaceae bacterium]|nr:ferredoxin family protein [Polyangiaceae bacterium]